MAERNEWVEIVEPRTHEHMYANLFTGECAWHPPPGVKIKQTTDMEQQWWELYDNKTSRFYYYNAGSQKTVWHRPQHGDIIPLAKLQTLKNNTEVSDNDVTSADTDTAPILVQREISTQTPTPKKEVSGKKSERSRAGGAGVSRSATVTHPSSSSSSSTQQQQQPSAAPSRKQHHGHHARRTQSALDKGKPEAVVSQRHVDSPHVTASRHAQGSSESKVVSNSGPQRSLESPKPRPGVSRDNGGHAHPAASHFQRQDSCPMMRDGGRGPTYSRDLSGQYQDVSQITAVQVTPRPKPRAFPRTNPSYVSVHRREGNPSAFRHVDTMAASAFNHGYQMQGQSPGERSSSGRYYPSLSGAQTLQTSHSYLGSESGRRSGGNHGDDHDNVDSDSSVSSSSSDASVNGLRRQYTLDSKPMRRQPRHTDQSELVDSRSGAAGLVGISAAMSRHLGGPKSAEHRSPETSPLVDQGPVRRSQRHARQPRSEPDILPPPRTCTIPNGIVRPSTARRNSEPDYVNFPPKSESQLSDLQEGIVVASSARSGVPAEQSHKSVGTARDPARPDEHPRSGDGTLRIRDHMSPAADYVNCQDFAVPSSNVTSGQQSAFDDHAVQYIDLPPTSYAVHLSPMATGFSAAETHHPSLRRRKWVEKPGSSLAASGGNSVGIPHGVVIPHGIGAVTGVQHMRQAALEKSLSLQVELAQQRPLSMVVPFGGSALEPNNAIVNQVADTLLQQMDIERFLSENLNEHRKGILGKTVPVGSMLIWTRDMIQKPMIKTENKLVKKEAAEVFKLVQVYMGDRKVGRDAPLTCLTLDIVMKGWSVVELRDEIFIQMCRQTTRNPREESLLRGWELLAICLSFFPPSAKFQSYLEGHIFRCLDTRDHTENGQLHRFASACMKRLGRVIERQELVRPSADEVEHSRRILLQPSMFGGTLDDVMDMQQEHIPSNRLPWIQTVLSEKLLRLSGNQLTEGIFRVPGDADVVSALKAQCDNWVAPSDDDTVSDPNIIASLLKLWYRELHEPLIPREYYGRCVDAYSSPDDAVKIVGLLPQLHRLVLSYLVRFLQKFAAREIAAVTKMDANNLAMVMAPNCLRCDSDDPQVMFDNARKEMGFIRLLIQHLDTSDVDNIV